jgi:hypothetical protein
MKRIQPFIQQTHGQERQWVNGSKHCSLAHPLTRSFTPFCLIISLLLALVGNGSPVISDVMMIPISTLHTHDNGDDAMAGDPVKPVWSRKSHPQNPRGVGAFLQANNLVSLFGNEYQILPIALGTLAID